MKINLNNEENQKYIFKWWRQGSDKRIFINLVESFANKGESSADYLSIDLSGIESLHSNDLNLLMYYKQYAIKKGVEVILANVTPSLYALLELTRIENHFYIIPSRLYRLREKR